jgi:hypothetical protein
MSLFGLKPNEVLARIEAAGGKAGVPTLAQSLIHGTLGFTLVSLAAYAPWAFGGRWFYRTMGEAGLYAVCAAVFIGLSGVILHRLVIGPGTLGRFYGVFTVAFLAYAIAWCAAWFGLRGKAGEWIGSLAGTLAFAAVLSVAFGAGRLFVRVAAVVFILHSIGYFAGGWAYSQIGAEAELKLLGITFSKAGQAAFARMSWGLGYGLGFGAAIGYAFHACQAAVRRFAA